MGVRSISVGVAIAVAAVAFVGCSATPDNVGNFSGPYANEFSSSYRNGSVYVKEVLKDGVISEQEFSETITRFTNCLNDQQITILKYEFDGSYEIHFPANMSSDKANEITKNCSRSSDEADIGSLYAWLRRNPDRIDENQLLASCLVNKKVVPSNYDAATFVSDQTKDVYPFFDKTGGEIALKACRLNPLH